MIGAESVTSRECAGARSFPNTGPRMGPTRGRSCTPFTKVPMTESLDSKETAKRICHNHETFLYEYETRNQETYEFLQFFARLYPVVHVRSFRYDRWPTLAMRRNWENSTFRCLEGLFQLAQPNKKTRKKPPKRQVRWKSWWVSSS